MRGALIERVLERLAVERPAPDLGGLRRVYDAWCQAVPFDNVHKLLHLAERRPGPLPGSTPEAFFAAWLSDGTGGTCWAGNGALHALLVGLGFAAERAAGTMLVGPDTPGPNHGSVVVSLAEGRYLVDASILSGAPLRLPEPGEPADLEAPLPRIEWLGEHPVVRWRTVRDPQGFLCRIERVGLPAAEWDERHQRTAAGSPFNTALSVRARRGPGTIGFGLGQRFAFDARGALSVEPRDRAGRDRFLVQELGVSPALVARLPDDLPPP